MNRTDYEEKLTVLISDPDKFIKCRPSQSENIKTRIKKIASKYKENLPTIYEKLHIVGNYKPGHLYGLPKLHKNSVDPPLRPINSMSGTVTHGIAQYLNEIIRPYIYSKYMVKSTDEFFLRIQNINVSPNQSIGSLDVTSLFTNVPVNDTINIILQRSYGHPTLPPPPIDPDDLKTLLQVCTQETPFNHKNQQYLQIDGVSMGSPLGPTFADFYMSNLEGLLLNQSKVSNPVTYLRYVDDIFVIFNSKSHIHHFVRRMKNNSKLKFTHEAMTGTSFNFLDLNLKIQSNGFIGTSIYIKPTDCGLYANFQSHIPLAYKKSVINALVRRAIKFSSTWDACSSELNRIKQVLANNHYPQGLVEKVINNHLSKFHSPNDNEKPENINFYFCIQNLSRFTAQSMEIKSLIKSHVKSTSPDKEVNVLTYFRPYKISSCFSTRSKCLERERSRVVYRFVCPEPACNAAYIGYTTQTLINRAKQHRNRESSIFKHFDSDHKISVPHINELISHFSIIYSSNEKIKLKIVEAIFIKSERPLINVKHDVLYDLLRLF